MVKNPGAEFACANLHRDFLLFATPLARRIAAGWWGILWPAARAGQRSGIPFRGCIRAVCRIPLLAYRRQIYRRTWAGYSGSPNAAPR